MHYVQPVTPQWYSSSPCNWTCNGLSRAWKKCNYVFEGVWKEAQQHRNALLETG